MAVHKLGRPLPWDFDLTSIGVVRALMKSRAFQPLAIIPNLFIFVVLIWAGLVGNPVGNHNAAIILIWVLWFFALVAVLIPFGGRVWCLMCPLPAPGEWLNRLGIIVKTKQQLSLGWKWPKKLDNIWLQNIGFLGIATFSPIILTRPAATSLLLLILIGLGIATSLLFQRQQKGGRIFCRYIDPVGGFIGFFSLMGALEVKAKDKETCRSCRSKACSRGTEDSWGCPWYEYPGGKSRNLYCGLCTECIKGCPYNNMSFKTRLFAQDLLKERKMDEAFKSLILVSCALLFAAVFFGWWGWLKDIADPLDTVYLRGPFHFKDLALYVPILWGVTMVTTPGFHLFFTWLSRSAAGARDVPLRKLFVDYAYALAPLGLMAWIAFVVGMVMVNGSYIVSVLSDPFGWGWNLLGTADYEWRPYAPHLIRYIQTAFLWGGLAGSAYVGYKLASQNFASRDKALRAMVPLVASLLILTLVFFYIFGIV